MPLDGRDDDKDFERYGGPITPGNLMSLLRACRWGGCLVVPQDIFDMDKMAREINGWLTIVGDSIEEIIETRSQ